MKNRPFTPMNMIASAAFCASMVVGAYDAQAQGKATDREDSRVTVNFTGVSLHSDREPMYNEVNLGALVEVGLGRDHTQDNGKVKTSFVGGAYFNSIRSMTYAAGVRGSYAVTPFMDVGLSLGVLTYPKRMDGPRVEMTTYDMRDPNLVLPEPYIKKGQSGYLIENNASAAVSTTGAMPTKNTALHMALFVETDERAHSIGKGIPRFAPVPDISLHHGAFGLRVQGGYIPDTGWVGMGAATLNFGASKNQITRPGKRLCFRPRGRLGGGYKPK